MKLLKQAHRGGKVKGRPYSCSVVAMVYLWSDLLLEFIAQCFQPYKSVLRFEEYKNVWLEKSQKTHFFCKLRNEDVYVCSMKEWMNQKLNSLSYPKIPGIVHMNRYITCINSFYTVDSDVLSFVFIFISWFPKGFCGAICQTANHGRAAWCFYVNNAGQVL